MTYVKCDYEGCDWRQDEPIETMIQNWHKVNCPKCGLGPVINNTERRLILVLLFMQKLGLAKCDCTPEEVNSRVSVERQGDGPSKIKVEINP